MTQNQNQFVFYEIQSGIATLTLDHPPVNVVHMLTLQQLEDAMREISQDENVRVLILRAEGKMFSAGADVADHTAEKVGEMIPLFNRVCRALADFPVPTIAAVHGHALGGGCELVLCCDLAVMAERAKIGQPEIQLAAIAPVAALRLPYLTGFRVAADLMFSGRNLTAHEAFDAGLVNEVVPGEKVLEWAHEKAVHISGLSRAAMTLLKQALLKGYGDWAKSIPDLERLYLEDLMNTVDAHEGLAAFIEKRKPQWEHK